MSPEIVGDQLLVAGLELLPHESDTGDVVCLGLGASRPGGGGCLPPIIPVGGGGGCLPGGGGACCLPAMLPRLSLLLGVADFARWRLGLLGGDVETCLWFARVCGDVLLLSPVSMF